MPRRLMWQKKLKFCTTHFPKLKRYHTHNQEPVKEVVGNFSDVPAAGGARLRHVGVLKKNRLVFLVFLVTELEAKGGSFVS